MSEFRLIQISDTHLARRFPILTDNFHRVSDYIDTRRPDLVLNSGDLAFDGPTTLTISNWPRRCTRRCRWNAVIFPAITTSATIRRRSEAASAHPVTDPNLKYYHSCSARIAGASTLPAGASSASIRWS